MGAPHGTPAERLWRRVDTSAGPTGCWLWTGSVRSGYGRIQVNDSKVQTHRLAYELSTGEPIPRGMHIDHICHEPRCCNPQHLRLTTNKQNSENRQRANRNSASGIRGVRRLSSGRWEARTSSNRKYIYVGVFDTREEAAEAIRLKRIEIHTHNDADRR